VVNTVFDKCQACGSTNNDGWLLETVIDYETNLVSSREVPCAACEARKAGPPAPVAEPIPAEKPEPEQVRVRASAEPEPERETQSQPQPQPVEALVP